VVPAAAAAAAAAAAVFRMYLLARAVKDDWKGEGVVDAELCNSTAALFVFTVGIFTACSPVLAACSPAENVF